MILWSSTYGVQILRRWDVRSGSELQLFLERKTYLISTLLTYVFGFELLSLFLYIFTVDQLSNYFVGAMCAAGTLNVNSFGYSTLVLKLINFLLAGLWLIVNYTDNRGYDYPLIKKKYFFLLLLAPLILAETVLQANYFLRLNPNIITSCCGSLFSVAEPGVTSEIVSLPMIPTEFFFYIAISLSVASGLYFYFKKRGANFFSFAMAITLVVSLASILSFISVYFYELPTHHCPFCILKKEYGYVGYPLYLTLLGGAILGIGVGVLMPFKNIPSLSEVIPSIQRKLAITSSILLAVFATVVTYRAIFSGLILEGY